ncbi:MAG: hypothetical protein Q7T87_16275 [Polaromonas sp.]|nr:hypothetical protein [Polaromonas sp.]
MNTWNKLVAYLDATFGFPNRVSSNVKKLSQGFDNNAQEHVIWLEYRVKVSAGAMQNAPPAKPVPQQQAVAESLPMLRELLAYDEK